MPQSDYSTLVADYAAELRELFAPEPAARPAGPRRRPAPTSWPTGRSASRRSRPISPAARRSS